MLNIVTILIPQANYIFLMRTFYSIIIFLAIFSLYFNYRYIRRTMKFIVG